VQQIARLPGVGPSLARRIVNERARVGRFDSPDGLRGILGLGRKKVTALRIRDRGGEALMKWHEAAFASCLLPLHADLSQAVV
jgi:transposase